MKNLRSLLISLAITVALLWLLLRWTGAQPSGIYKAFTQVDGRWYLAALLVQLCIYPLRAARFASLLGTETWRGDHVGVHKWALVPVTMAHSMVAYLIPAKVGEASLVWYLRREFSVPASRGVAVLLVARLLDLATVLGFLCIACLVVGASGMSVEPERIRALGLLLLPLTLLLVYALAKGPWLVRTLCRLMGPLFARLGGFGRRLQNLMVEVEQALVQVGAKGLLRAALWSPPIWVGVFLFYAFLARGFGMHDLSLAQATFGAALAVLFGLLPISAFAGFGAQDAGWVLGFVAVGVDRVLATESGLAIHLLYAAHILILGLLAQAWMRRSGRSGSLGAGSGAAKTDLFS